MRAQTYQAWELIIVDDASRHSALAACLKNYAALDGRIVCVIRREKGGVGAATNTGLRKAKGAYVVLFDPEALMVEVALDALAREALRTGAKVIYSDEDKVDAFGVLSEPVLKPDWNYRLLLGVNYVSHLVMVDRVLLRLAGAMRADCDGAEHHDLLLRLAENCEPGRIAHLPEILYHARAHTGAAASAMPGHAPSMPDAKLSSTISPGGDSPATRSSPMVRVRPTACRGGWRNGQRDHHHTVQGSDSRHAALPRGTSR